MSVNYSLAAINSRLQAVVTTIDIGGANATMELLSGGTAVSSISMARPSGTINGGVLTFSGTLLDPAAANTGIVDSGRIKDSSGNVVISGLTVGLPLASADILLSNGLNSLLITAGQTVQVLSAQITGS